MISLVLYGRNDSYGYNLHKRAAISLNCMAEVLTDPDDEIIFVDYNTPDDLPTFPEAIQDTLTEKAKSALRILRVRAKHHERFRKRTHLMALEPIARNVAVRRSNPNNRWILSTNTDMVFVPRQERSLSEIAGGLGDGYYHLPRFEVPETLWESVDRMRPRDTIAAFEAWGREFHLNEIVYAQETPVYYDAPGDFQLMLRSDAFKIYGFDESMLLGWHVDSNIAKRLWLLHRRVGTLVDDVYGYHCDHTRQVTPMHRAQAVQNDLKVYFDLVRSAAVRSQARTWGLAGETVEELSLTTATSFYETAVAGIVTHPLEEPTQIRYAGATFNQIDYETDHVLPFLVDSVASYPRDSVLAWSGAKRSLLRGFSEAWLKLGFTRPILVSTEAQWLGRDVLPGCRFERWESACNRAGLFVFDWGRPEDGSADGEWNFDRDPIIRGVARAFRQAVRAERKRVEAAREGLRRFIGINAINNAMEGVFSNHIGATRTPLATRIRQGFLGASVEDKPDVLSALYIGQAGERKDNAIVPLPKMHGCVFYGPYLDLDPGLYRLTLEFDSVRYRTHHAAPLVLDVVSNSSLLACREITRKDLANGVVLLEFAISPEIGNAADWPRIEFRLHTPGFVDFKLRRAEVHLIAESTELHRRREFEIAPMLVVGPAGKRNAGEIRAISGVSDLLAYGPYFWLPRGSYEAVFGFRVSSTMEGHPIRAYVAYRLGMDILGRAAIVPKRKGLVECVIPFKVDGEPPQPSEGLLEFLVRSDGKRKFSLRSVKVRPATAKRTAQYSTAEEHLLQFVERQPAGRWLGRTILAPGGVVGAVFRSPKLPLPAGGQRLELSMRCLDAGGSKATGSGLTLAVLGDGQILALGEIHRKDVRRGKTALDFDVPRDRWGSEIEVLLHTAGLLEVQILSMSIKERSRKAPPKGMFGVDLLALFDVGPHGIWTTAPTRKQISAIEVLPAPSGVAAWGPALTLDAGNYDAVFEFRMRAGTPRQNVKVDIVAENTDVIAERICALSASGIMSFSVPTKGRYRIRVWASSRTGFYLTGVCVKRGAAALGVGSNGRALAVAQPNGAQRTTVSR